VIHNPAKVFLRQLRLYCSCSRRIESAPAHRHNWCYRKNSIEEISLVSSEYWQLPAGLRLWISVSPEEVVNRDASEFICSWRPPWFDRLPSRESDYPVLLPTTPRAGVQHPLQDQRQSSNDWRSTSPIRCTHGPLPLTLYFSAHPQRGFRLCRGYQVIEQLGLPRILTRSATSPWFHLVTRPRDRASPPRWRRSSTRSTDPGDHMSHRGSIEFLHQHKRCVVNQREIARTRAFPVALRSALRRTESS